MDRRTLLKSYIWCIWRNKVRNGWKQRFIYNSDRAVTRSFAFISGDRERDAGFYSGT